MKTLIIGDLHIGARNGNVHLFNMMKKFYENELFPYILDNKITRVIQLGDILDKRKNIDFYISRYIIDTFFSFFEKNNIEFITLSGNHDLYYRQSISIDGPSQLANGFTKISIIKCPTKIDNFILIPWICSENKDNIEEYLRENSNKNYIVLGHFELAGFPIQKGYIAEKGTIDNNIFDGYQKVISGHYHSPSRKGNISYIGTPYEITWSDYGDEKKFLVYNSDSEEFSDILTTEKMFIKILWNEDLSIDDRICENKYVKILVPASYDENKFNAFLKIINEHNPIDVRVIYNSDDMLKQEDEIDSIDVDNPFNIMIKHIEDISTDKKICDLTKELALEIYNKAQEEIK